MNINKIENSLESADPKKRLAAIEKLAKAKDRAAAEPLLMNALGDSDFCIRHEAIDVLCGMQGINVWPLFYMLIDSDGRVRKTAAKALARRGEGGWDSIISGDDRDFSRIADSKDARAVELLLAALGSNDPNVREEAAKALKQRGETAWADILGDNEYVDFISRLGKSKDPNAAIPLIKALSYRDFDTRNKAIEALGELKDPRSYEPLLRVFEDKNGGDCNRYQAAMALCKLKDPRLFDMFLSHLNGKDKEAASTSAAALGHLNDKRAVDPLIKVLNSEPKGNFNSWQANAAESLGYLKDSRAVEPLIEALYGHESIVEQKAIEALVRLGDPRAVDAFIRMLETRHHLRLEVLKALGEFGDMRAVLPLNNVAQFDSDHIFRKAALEALTNIEKKYA